MNPYENLPSRSFWRLAVASNSMFDIDGLWAPRFDIRPHHNVVTFGSCFAQHIGNALKSHGYNWLSTETPPEGLSEKNQRLFNYNIFSARTGNIYTTSLLKQWTEWALTKGGIPEEIWNENGRFYDPFRPRIEPNGFKSQEELRLSQAQTIKSFRQSIEKADFFVFTLGLTESWTNVESGYEYPMCPGTVAGEYDSNQHKFENQQFHKIITNLQDALSMMEKLNPKLRFILTVSPVPLTATKSDNHVLVATMESKSILRAVAGQLAKNSPKVDYFPSYEIINSPVYKGVFFEPNQRNVNPTGVKFVMDMFFKCLNNKLSGNIKNDGSSLIADMKDEELMDDVLCEEEVLSAFGGGK